MKIYVAHTKKFDYQNELYEPLKQISNVDFIFPHEHGLDPKPSKEIIRNCDLFIAEVSYPGFGTGIEIGWADAFRIPIIFLIKKGYKISSSLKILSDKFIEYDNSDELTENIKNSINQYGK